LKFNNCCWKLLKGCLLLIHLVITLFGQGQTSSFL